MIIRTTITEGGMSYEKQSHLAQIHDPAGVQACGIPRDSAGDRRCGYLHTVRPWRVCHFFLTPLPHQTKSTDAEASVLFCVQVFRIVQCPSNDCRTPSAQEVIAIQLNTQAKQRETTQTITEI